MSTKNKFKCQNEEILEAYNTVTILGVIKQLGSCQGVEAVKQKELNNPYEIRKPGTTPSSPGFRDAQKTTFLPSPTP